ncbi:FKBP-type peptidyl-prolyl cis-trans isomerase [Dysgonomonas sp. 520]|uniref:FKBP-type peptidyl-prolyl cis-trans isomerase n=1 Tax=Dysgonomonas sp. 520 TaxID=2302931 RepID=UPI0013D600D0|nr:FKBP-type peptidyl-prolyl cis-trans isomerase [Dysgonomonas sp. 520]NDW10267.1 FKBP-type peptidyl-prolyl cis-trans isomerase [Dysgonomonas sp. 520]
MKKIQILALGAFVAIGGLFTSCDSSGVGSLKTEADSLSYLFGAEIGDKAVPQFMKQAGLLTDTAALASSYQARIGAETDEAKKAELEKEFKSKLDSANTANQKNKAEFMKGLTQTLNLDEKKDAYAAGLMAGAQMRMQVKSLETFAFEGTDDKISRAILLAAVKDAANGKEPAIENPSEVFEKMIGAMEGKVQERQKAKEQEEVGKNKEEGQKYLDAYKQQAGVVVLPSGIEYKVLTEGTGVKPSETDTVVVHYHGTLVDGTVFDSSVNRGEPISFPVNQVIKGWTEVLQLMPTGSKWQVVIPSDLAYGDANTGGPIKGGSTLVFDIELIDVKKAK